jgi:hypothetical protein
MVNLFGLSKKAFDSKDKGFYFSFFPLHTLIILKTKNSDYEIELLENKKGLISGGNRSNNKPRFPDPTIICPLGSVIENAIVPKENWIGCGMRFEFVIEETQQVVITSEIINAEIRAKDKSWIYSMDWE